MKSSASEPGLNSNNFLGIPERKTLHNFLTGFLLSKSLWGQEPKNGCVRPWAKQLYNFVTREDRKWSVISLWS